MSVLTMSSMPSMLLSPATILSSRLLSFTSSSMKPSKTPFSVLRFSFRILMPRVLEMKLDISLSRPSLSIPFREMRIG